MTIRQSGRSPLGFQWVFVVIFCLPTSWKLVGHTLTIFRSSCGVFAPANGVAFILYRSRRLEGSRGVVLFTLSSISAVRGAEFSIPFFSSVMVIVYCIYLFSRAFHLQLMSFFHCHICLQWSVLRCLKSLLGLPLSLPMISWWSLVDAWWKIFNLMHFIYSIVVKTRVAKKIVIL